VTDETCTAELIDPPRHAYIENTIPSMAAAFAAGANAVELDVHRTTDGQLIVFHDWTLDCRTDGTGVTNQQTVVDLQRLDIGYGYTADGGRTFPLRGQGIGLMPTLPEVLAEFPDNRFIIHDKDGDAETHRLLASYLQGLPASQRALLWYWGGDEIALLQEYAPEVQPYFVHRNDIQRCLGNYLIRMLVVGNLPEHCRERILAIPDNRLRTLPGWPHLILARANQAGVKVYVADVDTPEEWASLRDLPLDGVQTNRIEELGPLIQQHQANASNAPPG
jgi:glycerophosphoryl diester phosphodiesterase